MSLLFTVTGLNNVVLPTLFTLAVDSCVRESGQLNIVQSCLHQYCNNLIVFSCVVIDDPGIMIWE
jgi:hypothetical protein